MKKPGRRLGRGLDSLVSDLRVDDVVNMPRTGQPQPEAETDRHQRPPNDSLVVSVNDLRSNPYQPRNITADEGIASLADSISRTGLLQPVLVRRREGLFEIIAGERRWRAAKLAGLTHLPVIVRDATDEQTIELALVENIQREDLNPIDRALAYQQFCTKFGLKPEDVARRLAEDRTTVLNYLRLLELPDSIRTRVAEGSITMGHARCLAGVTESAKQLQLAQSVVRNQLSVRALEEIVRREKTSRSEVHPPKPKADRQEPPHIRWMQGRFEETLKTKVRIDEGKRKGSGRITIEYYSLDDFERIASLLGVSTAEAT